MMERETRTILIVEGSATMLNYYGILLKRLEYRVLTATRPEDALKIVEHTMPSLILTAISFPSMDGVDFIKTLKRNRRTEAIPVAVMTADEQPSVRSACVELGCIDYLHKPTTPATLYRVIQAALESTPRDNIRINTSLKAIIGREDAKDGRAHIAYLSVISEQGAFVRTLAPKAKDSVFPITFYVDDRVIRAKAVVLYSSGIEDGTFRETGMGIKFTDISEDSRSYVRDFITSQLVSDIIMDPSEKTSGVDIDMT